ncbi:MAG: YbaK/EbsC family protein [Spirochaetaceae bacterium]|jgi:prolyl-tRNA editing enzyme YbaK/EbsC (Cys-tRNA(Pro) deacylase)|nr:YbaK/EbsC family protein [Spirochaetaceae bacterium]
MSIEEVKKYLARWKRDGDIVELPQSTATVAEAARTLGVDGARIAKSISLKKGGGAIVVVTAGDTKIDNRKFKDYFGVKATMLSPEEALNLTGHAVGGVCPFALPGSVEVYLDESLKRFASVFPACGSGNSMIELNLDELAEYSNNRAWVDVCKKIQQD